MIYKKVKMLGLLSLLAIGGVSGMDTGDSAAAACASPRKSTDTISKFDKVGEGSVEKYIPETFLVKHLKHLDERVSKGYVSMIVRNVSAMYATLIQELEEKAGDINKEEIDKKWRKKRITFVEGKNSLEYLLWLQNNMRDAVEGQLELIEAGGTMDPRDRNLQVQFITVKECFLYLYNQHFASLFPYMNELVDIINSKDGEHK